MDRRTVHIICLIIMFIILAMIMSGCEKKVAEESDYGGYLVKIEEYGSNSTILTRLLYDPITKVMYIKVSDGLSPYYVISHGEPVIAVYGKNWTKDMMK